MITARTETVVLARGELDLAGFGNRMRFVVPDSGAGELRVSARRLAGWAAEDLVVRRVLTGGLEAALSTPASLAAPTSPVETAEAAVDPALFAAGDHISIGPDTAEPGRVLVTVTLVVAAAGSGCDCAGPT